MSVFFPRWAAIVLVAIAALTVWLRLSVIRTTYEIGQVEKMVENARKEHEGLELELARQKSPRRLRVLASEKFGLSPPERNQVIYMRAADGSRAALGAGAAER